MIDNCRLTSSPEDSSSGSNKLYENLNGSSNCNHGTITPILIDVHKVKPVRLSVKVQVPIKDHPNFNFVGKLLGPKGNSLKWLQEETQTKMAILGKGSMRDKKKEEELRKTGDPKYFHLKEDLHIEIVAFAPAAQAYSRIGHALDQVKRFLVPDYYDDIRQQQLRELGILNVDRKSVEPDHMVTTNPSESEGQPCLPESYNCRCHQITPSSSTNHHHCNNLSLHHVIYQRGSDINPSLSLSASKVTTAATLKPSKPPLTSPSSHDCNIITAKECSCPHFDLENSDKNSNSKRTFKMMRNRCSSLVPYSKSNVPRDYH